MKKITSILTCTGILLFAALSASAQTYKFEKTIALPGEGGYDYAFIDQTNHVL